MNIIHQSPIDFEQKPILFESLNQRDIIVKLIENLIFIE